MKDYLHQVCRALRDKEIWVGVEQDFLFHGPDYPLPGRVLTAKPSQSEMFYGRGLLKKAVCRANTYKTCRFVLSGEIEMAAHGGVRIGTASPAEAAMGVGLFQKVLSQTCREDLSGIEYTNFPSPIELGNPHPTHPYPPSVRHGLALQINWSTRAMREGTPEGVRDMEGWLGVSALPEIQRQFLSVCGKGAEQRMDGTHWTAPPPDKLTVGGSTKIGAFPYDMVGPSIRISKQGRGFYIEDRRPSANACPYTAISHLLYNYYLSINGHPHGTWEKWETDVPPEPEDQKVQEVPPERRQR